jgi:hypothetical protein
VDKEDVKPIREVWAGSQAELDLFELKGNGVTATFGRE